MTGVRLAAVSVPGSAESWVALGLALDADGRVPLANGAIVLDAESMGLVVDTELDLPDQIDGVPVGGGAVIGGIDHPNGAWELDHLVVMTDSIDRTSAAIERGLGLEQRRVRETATVRQAFHRFDDQGGTRGCIVELVENARVDRPALWGLVVNVHDLDRVAGTDLVGAPKPAVQPGRRIATVRGAAGLGVAVAFMSA